MRNIHHLPPLKRAKHRITADLHDFLTFPGTDGRIAADLDGPFRDAVKAFLEIHAWPAHGFDSEKYGLRTWRMTFKVGDPVETVELVVTAEDVSRSRSIYCDQCRVVGWSGHPVCKERYHFIISQTPGYYVCTRCQNTLQPNNLRCRLCGYETKMDGLEKLAYPKLDDPSHLLHGVVHTNGYGHLLRLNGREGGSKLLSGHHIMSFWDRLCKLLHVRKITVNDVSRKFGVEYRLLHAVVTGHPWYGEWGYEFRDGSFALTDDEYQKAVETLSGIPLSLFFNYNRQSRRRLQNIIVFYWTLSGHTLVTLRDLFSFVIQQLNIASQKTESDNCTKGQRMVVGHTSGVLLNKDLEQQVEAAVIKILKAVGSTKWVTAHALRGAVFCRRAKSPDVMDRFLQTLGGKIIGDGSIITARYNADANTIEYRFLDKACVRDQNSSNSSSNENESKESPWRLCSVKQVEQVKVILSVIPIFACTIIFNTILAQLQTFSVQQGSTMNTHLTKTFKIPPASLQAIPYLILIVIVPLYELFCVPLARKLTGQAKGITPLQRIGIGLFTVTFSMVSAALVERERRNNAVHSNKIISIFWITPQFLIFGVSEMFTAVGLIEFFYMQSLAGMQSFLTGMTYCSYSFGFFLSSLLVSLVNKITSSESAALTGGWLSDNDLNKDRLDLFYWLLAALSLLNFFNYLFWSKWYTDKSASCPSPNEQINTVPV